jgi:hypothetical protein
MPLPFLEQADGKDVSDLDVLQVAGRAKFVTRGRLEQPGRRYSLTWRDIGWPWGDDVGAQLVGEDMGRMWRAAAFAGVPFALHRPWGDRIVGTPGPVDAHRMRDGLYWEWSADFFETDPDRSAVAPYNVARGMLLNGSSQFASFASNAALNPGASDFTVAIVGRMVGTASRYHLTKGNVGAAQAYGLLNTATLNQPQFFVNGSVGNATATGPANAAWFDGDPHVFLGMKSGSAVLLDVDGVQVATGGNPGTVTNAVALAVGANNGGASGFTADEPIMWAYWGRAMSAAERQQIAGAMLGLPGYRLPGGASLFADLRRADGWAAGTTAIVDLSRTLANGSGNGTDTGLAWDLADVDIW